MVDYKTGEAIYNYDVANDSTMTSNTRAVNANLNPPQGRGHSGDRDTSTWSRHQVWAVVLLVLQMAACERPATVAPPGEQRADASEALTVVIEPGHATADTDLTAVANDASVTYAWSVNGFPVEGESGPMLPKARFRRFDTVAVEITLNEQSARAETPIHNATPRTIEVALDRPLDSLHAGVDLTAMPKGDDADGDNISWDYQWIRNDEEIPGESLAVLRGDRYQRGDRVTVRVTPSDAFERGAPYTPSAVTIPNGAPEFVSRPPGWSGGAEYIYQVQAVDPDGDPVHYQLVKAPDGLVLEPATQTIRWSLIGAPPGRHAIEVQIDDGQGATASQPFELDLSPAAAPEGS